MKSKATQSLYFLATALLLLIVLFLSYSNDIVTHTYYPYWVLIYLVFGISIYIHLKKGIIYHPLVLIGLSYFLLLIVGSLTFYWARERPLNIYTFNLIAIGFSALMGGILLGNFLGSHEEVSKDKVVIQYIGMIYLFAFLGIVASVYMFAKFKGLPILAHNPNEAKVNFLSGNGIFNLFFKGLPVFSLALLYEKFYNNKNLWWAHAYCFLMLLIILAAGYRSTTLISLGEYIALYIILTNTKIQMKWIGIAGLLAIMFLAFWGAFRRGNEGLTGALREFDIVVNARPVIFETIVHNIDPSEFFDGALYYNDFKRFLPGVQASANVDLKYAIFSDPEAMPDMAGITPSITGEAYMNFGQRGVFWVLLCVGFLLGIFYRSFKSRPNFLRTALFLTLVFGMAGGVQSGLGLKLVHLVQFWVWVIIIGWLCERNSFLKISYSTPSATV